MVAFELEKLLMLDLSCLLGSALPSVARTRGAETPLPPRYGGGRAEQYQVT